MPADDFQAFAEAYASGRTQLLRLSAVGDCETPVGAYLKLTSVFDGPSFLLESVEGGAVRGRYSMIGLDPDVIWQCEKGKVRSSRNAGAELTADMRAPFESLRALLAESAIPDMADDLPPMAAGVFGYLGYDMVRLMERLPSAKETGLGLPDTILIRPQLMVVFDAVRDEISLVTPVRPTKGIPARAAHEAALARLDKGMHALEQPLPEEARAFPEGLPVPTPVSNTTPETYAAMVARAKDYILAGDIFQVVLSQRFDAPFTLPPFSLYRALRRVNPAPFLCYLDFESFQIVCSSPEILVRLRDGKVTIRPIAGTRPRGATPSQDEALAAELLADPKERAEHLMLLDLGRNDVGRVAQRSVPSRSPTASSSNATAR